MNELKKMEDYLLMRGTPQENLLFQASMVLDGELRAKVSQQKQVYELIKRYGRKKLRQEIEAVHDKLFKEAKYHRFKKNIMEIFSKGN